MNLENIQSIKEAQHFSKSLLKDLTHPRAGAVLALMEEVGELSKLVLDKEVYGLPEKREELAGELADVFLCLLEISNHYDIDLQTAFKDKMAKIELKIPKWKEELGLHLEQKRKAWDKNQ